jgi:hypothetical protein
MLSSISRSTAMPHLAMRCPEQEGGPEQGVRGLLPAPRRVWGSETAITRTTSAFDQVNRSQVARAIGGLRIRPASHGNSLASVTPQPRVGGYQEGCFSEESGEDRPVRSRIGSRSTLRTPGGGVSWDCSFAMDLSDMAVLTSPCRRRSKGFFRAQKLGP